MGFKREEIREALGEAYTDEIAGKLVAMHRSVVDPLKDQLDDAKRDVTKYKTEAEKVPGLQQQVKDLEGGEDWKAKYEQADQALKDYKAQVAQEATTAKVKAAYKKLLTEEKVSEKTLDAVLAATDFSKMKLKEDGTLDGIEDLKKDIDTRWGGFKVTQRQRGERVDNPPDKPAGGSDNSVREMAAKWHAQKFGAAPEPAKN